MYAAFKAAAGAWASGWRQWQASERKRTAVGERQGVGGGSNMACDWEVGKRGMLRPTDRRRGRYQGLSEPLHLGSAPLNVWVALARERKACHGCPDSHNHLP